MYKENVILEKLEKLKQRMLWKTGSTQTNLERNDILWVKSIIRSYPTIPVRPTDKVECNRLWRKYK